MEEFWQTVGHLDWLKIPPNSSAWSSRDTKLFLPNLLVMTPTLVTEYFFGSTYFPFVFFVTVLFFIVVWYTFRKL